MSIRNSLATIPVGSKIADSIGAYSNQLGSVVETEDGKLFQLVRLNLAAGLTVASTPRALKVSARATYDVEPVTATADHVCGTLLETQEDLEDNDIFWMQIDGRCELHRGDDGTAVVAGGLIAADDDAGTIGAVRTATGTGVVRNATEHVFAIAVDAAAAVDTNFTADLIGPLGI